jgi:redox-sensitive bicupin YhaK (pirin superfamily)
MKTQIHTSETRGKANLGWLDSRHTFSFSNYYNESRMSFGKLRVLNDDIIEGGTGFGTHPHKNMEIISIPLRGDLEHRDSMGNIQIIRENDVQIMSAGSGITHSEYNHSKDKQTNFLQIWVIPNEQNVAPRYAQQSFPAESRNNKLVKIVSPFGEEEGVHIHQQAWFYRGTFDAQASFRFKLNNPENGVYIFVIDGQIKLNDTILNTRDGAGITETAEIPLSFPKTSDVLLMEVPMQ